MKNIKAPSLLQIQKHLLRKDKSLKKLFVSHGVVKFEPLTKRSPFESLVRAIAHQQLHGKAAETILSRMIHLFPRKKFPTPEDLLNLKTEQLRACGFSAAKVKAIQDIALKTKEKIVPSARKIDQLSNQEIIERLTQIYGVGKWTVEMLLIFQLGRLDVWPVDDFGVRSGYRYWKKQKHIPKPKEIQPYGELWAPYQTVVALYLWREADRNK